MGRVVTGGAGEDSGGGGVVSGGAVLRERSGQSSYWRGWGR